MGEPRQKEAAVHGPNVGADRSEESPTLSDSTSRL